MPRFTPNLAAANAASILLEDGEYVFTIGQPKLFSRKNKKGEDVFGVAYALTVVEGASFVGKTLPTQMYLHTPGSLDMSKRFAMAALGYNPNDSAAEGDFNDKYNDPAEHFAIDTDVSFIGEVWNAIAGSNIAATVKQALSRPTDGSEPRMQNNFQWKCVG